MMIRKKWTDQALVQAICGSDLERDAALQHWFSDRTLQKQVHAYVRTHQGNEQDAEDVYTESLITFDRLIRNGQFEQRASLRTFFLRISRWQWYMMQRKRGRTSEWTDQQEMEAPDNLELQFLNQEKENLLEQLINQLGDRCKSVLRLYRLRYSMREIADLTGLSSEEMATKTAHQCRNKLKTLILSEADWLDLLSNKP